MLNNGYYIHLGTKFRCRVYEKTSNQNSLCLFLACPFGACYA